MSYKIIIRDSEYGDIVEEAKFSNFELCKKYFMNQYQAEIKELYAKIVEDGTGISHSIKPVGFIDFMDKEG